MKYILIGALTIAASALGFGCKGSQSSQDVSATSVHVAQAPVMRPTPTLVPKPTPTLTHAEKRKARVDARREARAERRRQRAAAREAEKQRQTEVAEANNSDSSGSVTQSGDANLAYELATIDNGFVEKDDRSVKRFQYLLGETSSHYKENQQKIADMTVKAKQLLSDSGVTESLENIMEGMNQVLPEHITNVSGQNMQSYAEYVSLYVLTRKHGRSHSDTINGMEALTGH